MRRVPFVLFHKSRLYYICPSCGNILPRDLYKQINWCPTCEKGINRTAKSIMKVYKDLDKEFYSYFIDIYRGEKK